MKISRITTFLASAFFILGIPALTDIACAEDKGAQDLAKASQNPISTLISVPFENISSFNNGPEDAYVNILNIKPVYPLNLSENWNLINRAIVPVIYQGELIDGIGSKTGMGDITYGTDLLFDYEGRKDQLKDLTLRKPWFTSAEIMIQATGNAGDCVALCGNRNMYGKVGVIEEGAMADVLIYDANPLEDVAVVEKHQDHLKLIVKDGKVFKNTL